MPADDPLLSLPEAAKQLCELGLYTTDDTVRRWVKQGAIPAIKLPSGHYRVRLSDVRAILDPSAAIA